MYRSLSLLGATALAMGCRAGTYHYGPATGACQIHSEPLDLDAQAANGMRATEVLAAAVERFRHVEVTWEPPAAPRSETFSFAFGEPLSASELTKTGDERCPTRTWVAVEVPVEITSGSGHLQAQDVVHLWGWEILEEATHGGRPGEPLVLVVWPHEDQRIQSTASGPYLEALEAAGSDEVLRVHLTPYVQSWAREDTPILQGITLGADYGTGGSVASVYGCSLDEPCFQFGQ